MSANREPTLAQLRNNSEQSRVELAATVTAIRSKAGDTVAEYKERLSIPHIKQEIRNQVRDTRKNLVQSVKSQALEHPLQAVAVGAGLAYPLWSLVRRVPVPLMLMGAGFWLAGQSRTQGTVEADLTQRAAEKTLDLAKIIKEKAGESTEALAGKVSDVTQAARDKATDLAGSVSDRVHRLGEAVAGATTGLRENTAQTTNTGAQLVSDAAAGSVKAKNAVLDFLERNPLLVAGSGLALGAFIAASIPRSTIEDRVAGQGSDFVKRKMAEAASAGVEHATTLAADLVAGAAASASQQGLNSEGISKAVEGLAAGIKSVATKGAEAVLGAAPVPSNDPTRPDNR
jgi:ElaB/YqjD/DUF883 family membrane-anchored ribosome-binding protein